MPPGFLLTRSVRPWILSRTKICPAGAPATRLVALEEKAITVPSRLTAGAALAPLAC
jgi:hypothetical protein